MFEDIGQVDAQGESSTIQNYSFLDKNPYQGRTYYRFQQLGLDGAMDYSDVKRFMWSNLNKFVFILIFWL